MGVLKMFKAVSVLILLMMTSCVFAQVFNSDDYEQYIAKCGLSVPQGYDPRNAYDPEERVIYKITSVGWNKDYDVSIMIPCPCSDVYRNELNYEYIFKNLDRSGLIRFVPKRTKAIPQWRNPRSNEDVEILGNGVEFKTTRSTGYDTGTQGFLLADGAWAERLETAKDKANHTVLRETTAKTVYGQSGAAVFGKDGKAIGVSIGARWPNNRLSKSYSFYVPYSAIKEAWATFEKNKKIAKK